MVKLMLVPLWELERVKNAKADRFERLRLLADMCRANALSSVKRAGSGHLGSSFSSLDIVTYLYFEEMNVARLGIKSPDRDVYFSSKGHDVPGQYAVLYALGVLPEEKFMMLRRLEGTCGHPDVSIPGIEANSGSLGMGISKAKGIAYAKRANGHGGRVIVMTGDGELQEGQIYESLQTAAHQKINNIIAIVDHNMVQSDKPVEEITSLGDLAAKFRAFGWHVERCDGHDFEQLTETFARIKAINDKPKVIIADTIKGKGVTFMEHPYALKANNGIYRWHSGAPDDASFERGFEEIVGRIDARLAELGLEPLKLREYPPEAKAPSGVSSEYVADAYGKALVEIGKARKDIVVLDADLAGDCRVRAFELAHPDRFIENGISEQDMVSAAGGLALQGMLPVVNSFASFLAARANEQIYNNACENTKVIYVCHYAGIIPAGPGQSHQSVRDISLFGALPNVVMLQPCNADETKMALDYCVNEAKESCVLRLIIGPSPRIVPLPAGYRLTAGRGVTVAEGSDAIIFAYGPVMMHEALLASEMLREKGIKLGVINMPWLNRADPAWLKHAIGKCKALYVVEDHSVVGGLGDFLINVLKENDLLDGRQFCKLGLEEFPAWGRPPEVLCYHGLDGKSLADTIAEEITAPR